MRRETSNVLIGVLVGAVAGGVAALLLAPASGEETRRKIKDTLRMAKDKTLDEIELAKDYAETRATALKAAYAEGKDAYQRSVKKHSGAPVEA